MKLDWRFMEDMVSRFESSAVADLNAFEWPHDFEGLTFELFLGSAFLGIDGGSVAFLWWSLNIKD